jgi:AraC-like DNA-binding protein
MNPTRQPVCMIPARSLEVVLQGIRSAGRDSARVLHSVGLDPALLEDPDARVSTDLASTLWREAVTVTSDRAFGIHAAETLRPGVFDVLDYAVRSSPTFGEGARLYHRYIRLLNTGACTTLEVGPERVEMTFSFEGAPLPPVWIEFILASWVVIGRQTTAQDWAPLEVRFAHPRPKSIVEHRHLFRCPLRFSADANAVVISRETFELPQVAADVGLCAVLERHARELFRDLPVSGTLTDQVRHMIRDELDRGTVSMETIAARLHMSVRTLGRRLSDEGTTYQNVLAEIRRQLATRYLREPKLSVDEVALLLGFSDVAVFRRAFKRWTGLTPGEFRGFGRTG